MAWAVTDKRITKNPAAGIRIRRAALPDHRYLDHETVAMLAKACEDYAPLVRLLAYTGLRWGEAAALRVKRVDLVRRRLVVAESVTEVNGRLVWGAPLSASPARQASTRTSCVTGRRHSRSRPARTSRSSSRCSATRRRR